MKQRGDDNSANSRLMLSLPAAAAARRHCAVQSRSIFFHGAPVDDRVIRGGPCKFYVNFKRGAMRGARSKSSWRRETDGSRGREIDACTHLLLLSPRDNIQTNVARTTPKYWGHSRDILLTTHPPPVVSLSLSLSHIELDRSVRAVPPLPPRPRPPAPARPPLSF